MRAICVSRAQQESRAHVDREDQRLVFFSRPLLSTVTTHFSLQWTFVQSMLKKALSLKHFEIKNISAYPSCDFNLC